MPRKWPSIADDGPITPDEEKNLFKSWIEFEEGEVTVVPGSCTDECFLKMLNL
jgi:hypothetical protein